MGTEAELLTRQNNEPIAPISDDDVEKVETAITRTPHQRATDLLSQLTAADAKLARADLARPKFRPKLERQYRQFCLAYRYDPSPNSRGLFVQYLENAKLGATRSAPTAAQQANTAMAVLFKDIKAGERLPPTTLGLREALDPRTELTPEQRDKLKDIILEDGTSALAARQTAEQLWESKKIELVIDVRDVYRSQNPHLAAFTSAALDAGYTQQEIDMATAGATPDQLWRPPGSKDAMPATLADFQKTFDARPQKGFLLDCTVLEEARAAIAQGMTLDQLRAARKQIGYDPNYQSKMTNESVRTVVEAFIPVELRPVIGPLLTALVGADPAQRAEASRQLQALLYDSKRCGPKTAKALRETIDGLQVQFGMGADPMLRLLRVQADMEANPIDFQVGDLMTGAGGPTQNQKKSAEQIAKARTQVETLRGQLRERQAAGTLPRDEAARIYEMMAVLYRSYIGDIEETEICTKMARYYKTDQAERDLAMKQMKNPAGPEVLLPRRAPDEPTSMRGPTKAETELAELEKQDDEQLAELEAEVLGTEKELPRQERFDPIISAELQGAKAVKNAEEMEAAVGAVILLKEFFEWIATFRRMRESTSRIAREDQLREQIKRESTISAPPPPERIREAIAWLERRIARDSPAQAVRDRKLLARARVGLDLALAFYARKS